MKKFILFLFIGCLFSCGNPLNFFNKEYFVLEYEIEGTASSVDIEYKRDGNDFTVFLYSMPLPWDNIVDVIHVNENDFLSHIPFIKIRSNDATDEEIQLKMIVNDSVLLTRKSTGPNCEIFVGLK